VIAAPLPGGETIADAVQGGRLPAMDHGTALLLLLGLGLPGALLFQRLGLSALVAYLVAGCIAGPGVLGWIDADSLGPLAQVGAALLLFTLGLEMDPDAARQHLRQTVVAGSVQVVGTIIAGAALALAVGFDFRLGVALGACIAMSSTLLLFRALDDRRLRTRAEGQVTVSVSLFQDIALGPILLILSFLIPVGHRPAWWIMLLGLIAVIGLTIGLRSMLASRLVARVRSARLPELEVALAVVFALGMATLSERCGLGAALGAFCAGLAFGGNESRQTALAATTSLGALTGIFFFAATGAMFDPAWAWANAGMVLGALAVSVAVKAAIAAAALRLAGMPLRTAVGCGILLGNIGEFSFILAGAAFAGSDEPQVQALHRLIIAVTFLSFLLMPLIAWLAGRFLPRSSLETITNHGSTVVVAGLGPVGNTVVGLLRARGLPVMLVDRNENLLKPWRGAPGIACFRGPVEDIDQWLPLLGHRPSLVVLAFPVADTSAVVTRRLRQLDPGLVVIARAPYIAQIEVLRAAGAQEVICDEEATGNALEGPLQRALRVAASDPNRLRATRFVSE
jgi:Kef-type K+ transport system membrane component KefB